MNDAGPRRCSEAVGPTCLKATCSYSYMYAVLLRMLVSDSMCLVHRQAYIPITIVNPIVLITYMYVPPLLSLNGCLQLSGSINLVWLPYRCGKLEANK